MDRESPELIEREMEQTRESLTEKVSLLEEKVVGQIHAATDTVQDTVESVQETVHSVKSAVVDTVESVSHTIKDTVQSMASSLREGLDVTGQVERYPWGMVGGAATAGFVTGLVIFRSRRPNASRLPTYTPVAAAAPPAVSHRPKWLDDLLAAAMGEVKKIAEQAIATASASLKQTVQSGIPKLIDGIRPNGAACRTGSQSGTSQFAHDLRQ
jgi:ElaB/YqjD/DUF883 family membrane-anchored ribosome-binding protein